MNAQPDLWLSSCHGQLLGDGMGQPSSEGASFTVDKMGSTIIYEDSVYLAFCVALIGDPCGDQYSR